MGLEFPILTILKGATDDKLSNFIVDKDNKVWAVDLDDYCKISISDRDKDWLKIKNEETLRLKELWNAL